MMSASPGRGGDGAGADRAQRATGSSTTIGKICSTDSGALSRFARAAGAARKDQRNLAALTIFAALTRAREGAADSNELSTLEPTCTGAAAAALRLLAATSPVLFSGIVVRQIRRQTMELGDRRPMLMSASPGRGGDGAGADRAQRATGSSTTIGKSAALTVVALSRALSALRPLRLGKISGIWQR